MPPLHPFLFAAYPVLFLFANNMDEARLIHIWRPMLIALALALVLLVLARLILRNGPRAAVAASLCIAMMFSYGYAVTPLLNREVAGYVLGRGIVLVPVWTLLLLLGLWGILRSRKDLRDLGKALNVVSLVLVLLAGGQIVFNLVQPHRTSGAQWNEYLHGSLPSLQCDPPADMPDIYYIILDEYSGHDVLQSWFGFDNTPFLDALEDRGFQVARSSHSNYTFTYVSLASSLNFEYLQTLADEADIQRLNKQALGSMIQDSRIVHLLKGMGYRFYAFPSEFYVTNRNPNADATFRRSRRQMNEFERVLFSTTMLRPLSGGVHNHRANRLYVLDKLPEMPEMEGPKFVFVHLIMPHLPYVFTRDGGVPPKALAIKNAYTREEYRRLYIGQTEYLNKRMEQVLDALLEQSDKPPVIVVQGDHGFRHKIRDGDEVVQLHPRERASILNALYLPGATSEQVYPGITPVNTFRIILNTYCGANLPLLDDVTYVAGQGADGGYDFTKVASWQTQDSPDYRASETPSTR